MGKGNSREGGGGGGDLRRDVCQLLLRVLVERLPGARPRPSTHHHRRWSSKRFIQHRVAGGASVSVSSAEPRPRRLPGRRQAPRGERWAGQQARGAGGDLAVAHAEEV